MRGYINVFLRLIFRRTWIASIVLFAVTVQIYAAGTSASDIVVTILVTAFGLTVLLQVGVVAHMAMFIVYRFLTWLPLTLDTGAWYLGQSLMVLLFIGALATYGFIAALGSRPVFGALDAT